MNYSFPPLHKGKLLRRYKRFFADITPEQVDVFGNEIIAHNPNTGSMKSLLGGDPMAVNQKCLFSVSDNEKRKLKYTLEAIFAGGDWMLSNTIRANAIIESAIKAGKVQGLPEYTTLKREYPYEHSKFDFYLEAKTGKGTFVEVKSVTFFDDDCAYFPDAVTSRGLKHLNTLENAVKDGYGAVMLYVCMIKRNEFKAADFIDKDYAQALQKVLKNGVKKIVVHCKYDEITNTAEVFDY